MIYFYLLNYSKLNDSKIEKFIISFLKYLYNQGIKSNIKIEHCEDNIKDKFIKYIYNKNVPLIDNDEFLLEVNSYLKTISKHLNTQNYKFIFFGENLKITNKWGEANDWIAVIIKLEEKVIWHEIAHLLGAKDHYETETFTATNICADPSNCVMTYGNTNGEICSESIREIKMYITELAKY